MLFQPGRHVQPVGLSRKAGPVVGLTARRREIACNSMAKRVSYRQYMGESPGVAALGKEGSMEQRQNDQGQGEQDPRIQVDEDWKKSVAEERQRQKQEGEQAAPQDHEEFPEPSIQIFMAGLYTQTLVALGALENPLTGKRETNAREAAYLIDTIAMIQSKTEGNLTPEESSYVQSVLYDLRMRYVDATRGTKPPETASDTQA